MRCVGASLALGELLEDNAKAEMGEQCKPGRDRDVPVLLWREEMLALLSGCWPLLFTGYHHQGSLLQ